MEISYWFPFQPNVNPSSPPPEPHAKSDFDVLISVMVDGRCTGGVEIATVRPVVIDGFLEGSFHEFHR